LLLPLILSTLAGGPIYLFTPRYGVEQPAFAPVRMLCSGILMAVVTYYGIRMGYRANQDIDGKHFIERYTILSVPVFIKFMVICIPVLFGLMIVVGLLSNVVPALKPHLGTILQLMFPLVFLWFYVLVAASIRRFGDHLRQTTIPTNTSSLS